MRKALLIALAAATVLSTPAAARDRDRHHGDRHHERHDRDRHHYDRGRYDRHRYDRHGGHRIYVGYRLPSVYYGPRYFVDYRHYGLRYPGPHLRWIRYGSDLLLVDVRRGIVVEVIPGRFY
jgi:Ni/Co efflux regulator RcnB